MKFHDSSHSHFMLLGSFRLDEELNIKVSDFGLSKDISEKNFFKVNNENKAVPVRWMSIEALEHGVFTTQSDMVCCTVKILC